MEEKHCAICKRIVDKNTAPILVMGGFANPRLLCDGCSDDVESMTTSLDANVIEEAMKRVSENLTRSNTDDSTTLAAVTDMFSCASERIKKIRNGENVSDEGEENGEEYEIPEELLETEEDRLLDEKEKFQNRLFDKIFTWVSVAVFAFIIGYCIVTRFII